MKKPKFTVDDHLETGQKLHPIRETLLSLCVKIGNAYPIGGRAYRLANKALGAVESLQCELDNCLFRGNPDLGDNATKVYYGSDDAVRTGREPLDRKVK